MEEETGEEMTFDRYEEKAEYFFDTYAIIEILKNNLNYTIFAKESVSLTIFNLAEIYYQVLIGWGEEKAETIYNKYKRSLVEIDDKTLKEAMKFRKELKKRDVSYTDAIGYIYAKRHNMKFLTGDKEFEKMDNVEFVK